MHCVTCSSSISVLNVQHLGSCLWFQQQVTWAVYGWLKDKREKQQKQIICNKAKLLCMGYIYILIFVKNFFWSRCSTKHLAHSDLSSGITYNFEQQLLHFSETLPEISPPWTSEATAWPAKFDGQHSAACGTSRRYGPWGCQHLGKNNQ